MTIKPKNMQKHVPLFMNPFSLSAAGAAASSSSGLPSHRLLAPIPPGRAVERSRKHGSEKLRKFRSDLI